LLDNNGYIDKGSIYYNDEDIATYKIGEDWLKIRGKEIAMVTQDPMTSLNPLKPIGKQIEEAIVLHQEFKGKEAYEKTLQLLKDVGIHDVERRYKQY
ncbi:ABC transporter ATP-binding protein, partial [Butyricicoccus sp. 1XD8-22]